MKASKEMPHGIMGGIRSAVGQVIEPIIWAPAPPKTSDETYVPMRRNRISGKAEQAGPVQGPFHIG